MIFSYALMLNWESVVVLRVKEKDANVMVEILDDLK